ncbi:MAG TPA: glycosyltransferase family 1 protein, partial [Vicinamibacterales bacterium]|nr:glycosyltransferase family 1 protein [Vicinamibacterales bacterium]
TEPSPEHISRVRERYQLDHQFVLYVGNIKPHKNLVRLIEAFSRLRQDHGDIKLLIIGDEISKLPALRRAVHSHKLRKHVRFLGYLKDDTLTVLYRLAAVFVFPSLYEGFGLPPLEAMASGTPVVTSNLSSLPEVTGDAAVLVDPYDVDSIEHGIRRVLDDPSLADDLRRKGLQRAREFSWERSVEETLRVYRDVAGRGQGVGGRGQGAGGRGQAEKEKESEHGGVAETQRTG